MNLARRIPAPGPGGQVLSDLGYYSRAIFYAAKDGGNLFTFAVQTLSAFGYAQGDPMQPAVSAALTTLNATKADTNLDVAGQTSDGEDFIVKGVGILINPNSDTEVARQLFPEISVSLKTAKGAEQRLGTPLFLPGGGGLSGTGRQDISAANSSVSIPTNGWPDHSNVLLIPSGFRWQKQGRRDSNLRVNLCLERSVGVQGVAGSPASLRLDLMVRLYGCGISARSPNV